MNDHIEVESPGEDDDPTLSAAGARLRQQSATIAPTTVEVGVLRRRTRRLGVVAGASVAVVALLGGLLVQQRSSKSGPDRATGRPGAPTTGEVEHLLGSLDAEPINPTRVRLVSTVSTFPDCEALIGDLRRVGAEHVGSRGFGAYGDVLPGFAAEQMAYDTDAAASKTLARSDAATFSAPTQPTAGGTTLGTNVQVDGVDELDFVKAAGNLIYDFDAKGRLRITDAKATKVLASLEVTPAAPEGEGEGEGQRDRSRPRRQAQANQLLVAEGRVAIFGTEYEVSEPVEGDPSATHATTSFMTVTFVDAGDPAKPVVTDRVRVEGSLVSARLVGGEIRLVTTANMADLGFVMPTTPNSVVKALDQNRRSVAGSTAPDWIPDWQRDGARPTPLVPCERVHVPDTFSGVAMTSMVTFPLGTGRFDPAGTSILAPADTLYAGLDKVAISSGVWVDPIDRDRLEFEDWQTAIHEFSFTEDAAPTYGGSGIVDGSTIGQFAFGEVGASLAVVTTKGAPWRQDPTVAVDLTILTPDGDGGLGETSKVADLANGKGEVTAMRFVDGRVLISTGFFGREIYVIDVTDPAKPRRAGSLTVSGMVGYFHPLPDHQALVISSRSDDVGEGKDKQSRSWVQAQLLDVSNADAPSVVSTWEEPWVADMVGSDHHAFTYWPDRKLAMWGLQDTRYDSEPANSAVVLGTDGTVTKVAKAPANKPNEVPSPCPTAAVTDPDLKDMVGPNGVVLRCDLGQTEVEWPRYQCYRVDEATIARFAPGEEAAAAVFLCSPAPPPTVSRVLVVSGVPILLTDQTLETLDPETFESTSVTYHPSSGGTLGY